MSQKTSSKTQLHNLRAIAAQILAKVMQGLSLSTAISHLPNALAPRDKSFVRMLCYGVLREYFSLQAILAKLLKKPLTKKDTDITALLLIGLYQIIHLRVPSHAAVNETTDAVAVLKKPWARGLVNAILRNFLRQPSLKDAPQQIEAIYNHPTWFIQLLQKDYAEWQAILAANNQQAPLTLRVNQQHMMRDDYLAKLATLDIPATATAMSPVGVTLGNAVDINEIPGFAAGDVSVQDEAAQCASLLLDLKPGLRVLDACAAPGGKLCHILELEPLLASVVALENDPLRFEKITQNLSRLKLTANCQIADALQPATWWDDQLFDRILLDAPCSGSGVVRRHPDSKLLRREEDIKALAQQQAQLLRVLWPLLAKDGLLVYATCSLFKAENDNIIAGFLADTNDVDVMTSQLYLKSPSLFKTSYGWQLLPTEQGSDGFYYALLRKKK